MRSSREGRPSKPGERYTAQDEKYDRYKDSYHYSSDERRRNSKSHNVRGEPRMLQDRRKDDITQSSMNKYQEGQPKIEYHKRSPTHLDQQPRQRIIEQRRSTQIQEKSNLSKGFSHLPSNRKRSTDRASPDNKPKANLDPVEKYFHRNPVPPMSKTYSYSDEKRRIEPRGTARSNVDNRRGEAARYNYSDEKNRTQPRDTARSTVESRRNQAGEMLQETVMIRSLKKSEFISHPHGDGSNQLTTVHDSLDPSKPYYHSSTDRHSSTQENWDSSASIPSLQNTKEEETSYSWVGEFLDDEEDIALTKSYRSHKEEDRRSRNIPAENERNYSRKLSYDRKHSLTHSSNEKSSLTRNSNPHIKFKLDNRYKDSTSAQVSSSSKSLLDQRNKQVKSMQQEISKGMPKTGSSNNEKRKLGPSEEQLIEERDYYSRRNSPVSSPRVKRTKTKADYYSEFPDEKRFSKRISGFSPTEKKERHLDDDQRINEGHVFYKRAFNEKHSIENVPVRRSRFDVIPDSRFTPNYKEEKGNYMPGDTSYLNRDVRQLEPRKLNKVQIDKSQRLDHFSIKNNSLEGEQPNELVTESHYKREGSDLYAAEKEFHTRFSSSPSKNSKSSVEKVKNFNRQHDILSEDQKIVSSNEDKFNNLKELEGSLHRQFEKQRIVDKRDRNSVHDDRERKGFYRDRMELHEGASTLFKQHGSSSSTHSSHRKKDTVSVSDFSGAWQAATNASIKVEDQCDPKLLQHNAKELAFALKAAKVPLKHTSDHQKIRGSAHQDPTNSSKLLHDKREVLYASKQESTDRCDPFVSSGEPAHKRVVVSNKSFTKQESADSRNVRQQKSSRNVISSRDNDGFIVSKKQIPANEREFWEKDFVDWFSKHILPTQAFKVYMKNVCPQMTSSDLAAMPMNFLEYLQDGDRFAINCIPKDKFESRKLFSFLGKFRELEDMGEKESHLVTSEGPSSAQMYAKDDNHPDSEQCVSPMKTNDANIPVLISGNTLANEMSQRNVLPVRSVENTPTTLSSEQNVQNLIITCDNRDPASSQSQEPSVHSLSRTIVNEAFKPSEQGQLHSQIPAAFAERSVVDSGISNAALARSDLVNPRWNAQVQDFIGRVQSSNSRPSYLDYLEKSGLEVKVSEDSSSDSNWHKSPSPRSEQRRSLSPRESNLSRSRRRSRDRNSRSRHRDHYSGRSPSRDFGRKQHFDSRTSRQTTSDQNETSHSRSRTRGRSPNKDLPKESRKTGTSDDKSGKASTTKTTVSSRQLSSRKLECDKGQITRRKSSVDERSPTESQPQRSLFKVFGVLEKRPLVSEKETHNYDAKTSKKSEFSSFKRFLKNYAAKYLNFMYNFGQYDSPKIMKVINDCRHEFSKANHHELCCSRQEAIYILKEVFMENSKTNIQVNLKRKLSERGKDWDLTSFETFQKFQEEVFHHWDKTPKASKVDKEQYASFLHEAAKQFDQLYPQYCGDVEAISQMWLWKSRCEKKKTELDTSFSQLEGWKSLTSAKKGINDFLTKQYNFPVFENSDRKSMKVVSAIQSKLKSTKEEAINHVLLWWLAGYYKCRYDAFEKKSKFTISITINRDETTEADKPEVDVGSDDVLKSDVLEENMIIVDETHEEKVAEATETPPEISEDLTDPVLLEDDLGDLEDDDVKEYAEDDSGCPTILLY